MRKELDAETVSACRRADRAAFRALVSCYQDRVYALCVALAGSDGEDLAQETFVRVHGAIARFEPAGAVPLSGWILTIARRLCVDRARAQHRQTALTLDLAQLVVSGEPMETQLERAQNAHALRRAIDALPVDQRAVVALQLWDELDYEEIAAVEAVPVGTVRSRLARAKESLRRALGLVEPLQKGNADGH